MVRDAPKPIALPAQVWEDSAILGLCHARDANGLFRLARKHGMSNERIAYWVGIQPTEVSKRINDRLGPITALDRWLHIADGFGMPDEARRAIGLSPVGRCAGAGSPDPSAVPVERPAAGSAVDPEFPATLLELLGRYARTDNMLGPRSLLAAVTAQSAFIEQLWQVAGGSVRRDLLAAGCRYAEFAGWLHQDAGDRAAAARWTLQALELANAAESPLLAAYVLMRRSNQASGVGDGARTLGLATAALDIAAADHPLLNALSLRQRARGHALDGNLRGCAQALEDARENVARASADRGNGAIESLAGYCTPNFIEMEAADCWMTLGQPARAVPIFEAELATWPELYHRDRGVHLARLACAYASSDQVERALDTAFEAVTAAEQTGSSRVADELGRSLHHLRTSVARPDFAPLQERITALASPRVPVAGG